MLTEETTIVGVETPSESAAHVRVSGRLGWDTDAKIKKELLIALGDTWSAQTIVLDLAEVRFVDSSGISALLGLRRELGQRGGTLALCQVPPRIRQTFELVGMYRLIPVVSDLEHAQAELVS